MRVALTVAQGRRSLQPWERFAALLAAAVALALNVAASVELFVPQSTFGYHLIYTNGFEVVAVDPGTAAARASIRAGDQLDFTKSTLHDRILGLEYQPARAGEAVTFSVLHAGNAREVTLRASPLTRLESQRAVFSPLASFLRLAGFGYIAVALIILLRRPNRMTWGLFLYLVSATDVTFYRFPDWIWPVVTVASNVLDVAGAVGLVIFAVRFPDDRPVGWRAGIDRLAIPIGAFFVIPNLAWDATSLFLGRSPMAWMSYGSTFGGLVLILIASATLVATYVAAKPWARQRLQWVFAGVFFSLLNDTSNWARYWSTAYPLATADAVVWIGTLLYASAPFAIAYAVVRQRVFEISFVVSRTVVFTIIAASIFATFALIEWVAVDVIEQSGVTIVLVALTAVAVSFSLDAVHTRLEQLVEGILFRRRRLAERYLAEVSAGLPGAQSVAQVEEALVRQPVQAFSLESAALFTRDDSGDFVRDGSRLDRAIVLRLEGRRQPLRLHELDGRTEGDSDPVLAVPIFVWSQLQAVVTYGAHRSGEDIDPDEASSLGAIGTAAGIAYEHIEAARVEREVARWRKLAEHQARELATLRDRIALLGEHLAGDDAHRNGPV
jgi:hypothetical protein